jgi:hypothetical protein
MIKINKYAAALFTASGLLALLPCIVRAEVYTCVDANGRKLTSDRPIAECVDREQQVLNPSGTLKARVGPSLTAKERAAIDQKEKQELVERNRLDEERRRDRALLIRYPNRAVHEQERAEALTQVSAVIRAATSRLEELERQRAPIDSEMEFYKKDPSKAPAYLRRQLEESVQNLQVQKRFIQEQEAESQRINSRFDEEDQRLRQVWPSGSK